MNLHNLPDNDEKFILFLNQRYPDYVFQKTGANVTYARRGTTYPLTKAGENIERMNFNHWKERGSRYDPYDRRPIW